MKISPEANYLKSDIESTQKRLENLRKIRLEEEEKVKKYWEEKIEDTKMEGNEKLYQTQAQGQDNIAKEILSQEERLKNVRDSYQDQSNIINAEKELLSDRFEFQRKENAKNQILRISELQSNVGEQGDAIGQSLNQELTQMSIDKDRSLREAGAVVRRQMAQKYNANEKVLNDEDLRFKDMKNKMYRDNSAQIFLEKMDHEKEVGRVKSEGMIRKEQQKQIYEKELSDARVQHEEILKAETKSFEQKLNSLKNLHEAAIAHVKLKNGSEIQSLLENQSTFKEALTSRSEDPFYSTSLLNPVVEDKIKYYEIKMNIPEFEEKSVILSGNKRDLKITHARKAEAKVELPDGSTNKSNRNETFLKEFRVNDIIDPSKITRNYNDGVLTFKIEKL